MKANVNSHRRAVLCALALFAILAGVASAQDYRAKVQGMVLDPSGAAVAGAMVTLRNINTSLENAKQCDSVGHYLFDLVQPGTYSVSVQASGFQKFVQQNVTVLTRGDVTVNATLTVGEITQSVNVTEEVSSVEFNTSTMTTTVQGNMLKDLPVLARNPFTLAMLNPAVVNQYWDVAHRNPFYMWSNGGLDIGGPTGGKNDQELDGTTLNVSARGSYNAPMDAVQELAIQQNAMDSEFGFSAGGTLSLSMKSGTNDFHGTTYYFGRTPALNALANRITRDPNIIRQNIWGGTLGNPIKKNKLFNFFAYEQWIATQPSSKVQTVPTEAERNGDFSHSLTPQGTLRTIYDPFTTVFDPATSTVTRQPFPGNIIPPERMDPAGKKALADLWLPNGPGDDLSGLNNFKKAYAWWLHYWNISERVDYNVNDRWRMFARFSKFQTRLDNPNWGGTIAVPSDNGGVMDAMNAAIDVLYLPSPRTTVNFRFGATYDEDDYASAWAQVPDSVWAGFWPNGWYKNVLQPSQGIYYPNFNFTGNYGAYNGAYTGFGGWWLVHGRSFNPTVNVTHDRSIHHLKAGWQLRYSYDQDNANSGPGDFKFDSIDTASSFLGYNATQSGNMYASALLGVLNGGSARIAPDLDVHQQQWSFYFQDDIKLTRNITLNLGLRWERETAPLEETRMLVRTLDLTNPIPELQNVSMPAEVTAIAKVPYKFNGAMIYTDNSQPRMYDAPWKTFLPRVGVAIRIDDKTSFRTGYARYAVPWVTIHPETGGLATNGFSQSTSILGPLQGMPRTLLSDPFPAGSNPVLLPVGNSLGRYQDLGNGISFWDGNVMKTPINDRINFTIQRQAPQRIFTEATFFMMFGHNVQDPSMWGGHYDYNLNQMDPNLEYQYKGAVDQAVANPFYNLLPPDKMPGTLRTQPTVSARQLLRPYPQYGDLYMYGWPGNSDHYYALQLKAERPMANGLNFLLAYNYSRETHGQWFNDVDNYNNKITMFDRARPRHNLRIAGTWELPFGRGRQYGNNLHPVLEAIIGGWATSHIYMWRNGNLLWFNPAQVSGDPTQSVPDGHYFNPAVFSILPAYTPRSNPFYYDGLRGPRFWQLDSTLAKYFRISERMKFELRMEFYNMPNAFMPSDPDLGIGSGTMGRSTWVAGGNYGREIQYTARIHF